MSIVHAADYKPEEIGKGIMSDIEEEDETVE